MALPLWSRRIPAPLREFVGYTAGSAAALLVDVGLLIVLVEQGFDEVLAATLAFMAGMGVIYLLSIRWIFSTRTYKGRMYTEFVIFFVIGVIGLLINALIMWLGTAVLAQYYLLSKAVSVVVVFLWNFAARKRMLFTNA